MASSLLAELIDEDLQGRFATGAIKPLLPRRIVASQIAAAQIAVVTAYLDDPGDCTSADISRALVVGSQALLATYDITA